MKKLILLLLISMFCMQCDERFEEINTNELIPTKSTPGTALPSIIFNDGFYSSKFSQVNFIMQYVVNTNSGSRYDVRSADNIWNSVYATVGNINDLITASEGIAALDAYTAAGKIMRAYYMAMLTDLYIDVPFSEAGEGLSKNYTPAYDTQEFIFNEILNDLREANDLLALDPKFIQGGDILYSGNSLKWQKLANSLRVRYLVRIANASSAATLELKEVVNNPNTNPVFESNADNAIIDYTGVPPFIGPFDNTSSSSLDIISPGSAYVKLLSPADDPRLDFFYDLPRSGSVNHVGVNPGLSPGEIESETPFVQFNASLASDKFIATKGLIDYAFMTYSELNFLLAEASLSGFVSGNAEEFYNTAIASNFSYWGLSMPDAFLTRANVNWDGTLTTLINQKWAAAFYVFEFESWSDYKRLGLPNFSQPLNTFPSTEGKLPTRMVYPVQEQVVNIDSYTEAVARIGGDNSLAKHWFQK